MIKRIDIDCNVAPIIGLDVMVASITRQTVRNVDGAVNFVNSAQWDPASSERIFKSRTNLSSSVRLQPGTRVMFLNNSLIEEGICNDTMGVITDVNPKEESARVASSIRGSLIDANIPHYFEINGNNCYQSQFPLQNCFALTIHKTQEITLPRVSLALDRNIFFPDQTYITLSRCPT